MTIAYYNGGVRVVDLSGLVGVSLGGRQLAGAGMKEVGSYRFHDGDTWSAKTPRDRRRTATFYLYGNDIERGLDVYRYTATAAPLPAKAGQVAVASRPRLRRCLGARPRVAVTRANALVCTLRPVSREASAGVVDVAAALPRSASRASRLEVGEVAPARVVEVVAGGASSRVCSRT